MLPSIFEYAPEVAVALLKMAAVQEPPLDTGDGAIDTEDRQLPVHPALHATKAILSGAAGTGVGMLAGYGAGSLAQKLTGNRIPASAATKAGPILGGAAGLAYSLYKNHESEEIARALQAHRNQAANPGV